MDRIQHLWRQGPFQKVLLSSVGLTVWYTITLNAMLDAEVDEMCNAQRYEHSPDRVDTRAGSYKRKLHNKAGEIEVKVPKLRQQTFETAIIERYRRRDISI